MKKLSILLVLYLLVINSNYAQKLDHVLGDILIQLNADTDVDQIKNQLESYRNISTQLEFKREVSPPLRIWLIHFDFTKIDENDFLHHVQNTRGIENAQLNRIGELRQTVPNDPDFDMQWMWLNTGQSGGLEDADIDVDLAWDLTTGGLTADGREIVVCVVEGANRQHPDLQGNLWYNEGEIEGDEIDNDGNGYIDDYEGWHVEKDNDNVLDGSGGHGTFVSGIIGGKGNNGQLITGVNWDVKIMHVDFNSTNEANVIAAYTYPLVMRRKYNETGGQEGAFVVATNSSWGINGGDPSTSPLWCAMYDSLGVAGILSCAATTNDDNNIDIVGDLPTGCSSEYLISVTASDNKDERDGYGYGVENVDLAAPGDVVYSINLNGGPASKSGTSFASPTVAGVIALLYSAPCNNLGAQALGAPQATAEFIRDAIYDGVDPIQSLVGEVKYGGRLNAKNSIDLVLMNCGPCPKPFGVVPNDITDTSFSLNWFSTDSTLSTYVVFRKVNNIAWDTLKDVTSPLHIDDLKACTEYEWRLIDFCQNESSGYTETYRLKTDGCCEPPQDFAISDIDATSASFSWSSVLAANSYDILLFTPSDVLLFDGITSTVFELPNLDSCTAYSAQIRVVCDNELSLYGQSIEFKTEGCGNCTDLPYCTLEGDNATNEWIANVSLNTIDNSSDSDGGYGNFTNISTDLTTYQAYNLEIVPGYESFNYNEWFGAYIDFNQDGDFDDDDEMIFTTTEAVNDPVNGLIYIPGHALNGSTRMRVVMQFGDPTIPCNTFVEFGEVEDYCINILEGTPVDCAPPSGLSVSNIVGSSADFSWNSTNGAFSYEVRLKTTNTQNWAVIAAPSTQFSALNLEDCKNYETQVRSVCATAKSEWSASTFFMSDCVESINNTTQVIDYVAVTPNPFSDNIFISFYSSVNSAAKIKIIDVNGKIKSQKNEHIRVGEQLIKIPELSHMADGIYFLNILTGNGQISAKLVKF